MEIFSVAFDEEHELVGREIGALAVLYQRQGKHELAEKMHQRAVAIRRKNANNKPRSVRIPLKRVFSVKVCCFGLLLSLNVSFQRQVKGLAPLRKRLLQLEELVVGTDSTDLARTLNEIGVLYYFQNDIP